MGWGKGYKGNSDSFSEKIDSKGSRKNKFAELALRFRLGLVDLIEQNTSNSELLRGFFD
jgi:hypothetical protein